jgi:hypothetical protein
MRGYVLSEALVAVAIGALVLSGLMALDVDFIGLTRRAADLGAPYRVGARLEQAVAGTHRCDHGGAALAVQDGKVVLAQGQTADDFITLQSGPAGTTVAAGGASGAVSGPARVVVLTAAQPDASARPGFGVASIEAQGAPIATASLRCDLPEICDYDPAKGVCRGKKT